MKTIRRFTVLILALCVILPIRADDAPAYNKDVQVKVLMKSSTNSAGQPIEYPHEGTPEVSILMIEIAPGKQTGWHKHPVPLFGYVMSGQVTVNFVDGTKHTFRQGDALAEAVNVLHNGVNEGTEPTKLLIVVTGEKDVPFTKKALVDKDGKPLGDADPTKPVPPDHNH